MSSRSRLSFSFALAGGFALLAPEAGAQGGLKKCLDAGGRVTYSSEDCKKQGLRDAGPVKDRVITVPAARPKPAPTGGYAKDLPPQTTGSASAPAAGKAKPGAPPVDDKALE